MVTVQLSFKIGAWMYALGERCQVTIVEPARWRSETLPIKGVKKKGERFTRPELKQLAKDFAMQSFAVNATEDEADAICIAFYGVRRMLFGD
jgi:hypothetical protein